MKLPHLLAKHVLSRQLARPSGFFGRHVMGRLLNRTTSLHNQLILTQLAVQPTDRVLEVGFGGASLLEKITRQASEGFVAGLELSTEMVANATTRMDFLVKAGRLEVRLGKAESLPYPKAHFNKACSVNTVYFWPDLAQCFAEFYRVLRTGGQLVLGFTADKDVRAAGLDQRGFSAYSLEELTEALVGRGFQPGLLESGSDARGTFFALTAERRG